MARGIWKAAQCPNPVHFPADKVYNVDEVIFTLHYGFRMEHQNLQQVSQCCLIVELMGGGGVVVGGGSRGGW